MILLFRRKSYILFFEYVTNSRLITSYTYALSSDNLNKIYILFLEKWEKIKTFSFPALCFHLFGVEVVALAISDSSFSCRWRIVLDSRATKLFNVIVRFYGEKNDQ